MDSLLRIFPQKRRAFWQKTADNGEKICEIRLRAVSYTHLTLPTKLEV